MTHSETTVVADWGLPLRDKPRTICGPELQIASWERDKKK
jgi:hypothetical protein